MNKHILTTIAVICGAALLTYTFWSLNKQTSPHSVGHTDHGEAATSSPYQIVITSAYDPLHGFAAKQQQHISFVITNKTGGIVTAFDTVHEKKMHVIIARGDLSHFEHIHPSFNEAIGQFSFDLTVPKEGFYRMFADFTESGKENSVTTYDLMSGGLGAGIYAPLVPTTNPIQGVGNDLLVRYHLPATIQSDKPFTYSLEVVKDGVPVAIEPYLGARGHSVILKEGNLEYTHAHADDDTLSFSALLTQSGRYKMYTQFQYQGKVYTSEYVIALKTDAAN